MLAHSQCITMYYGYAQLDMREYRMYNMYSRNFAGPVFDRIVKKRYVENILDRRKMEQHVSD